MIFGKYVETVCLSNVYLFDTANKDLKIEFVLNASVHEHIKVYNTKKLRQTPRKTVKSRIVNISFILYTYLN